MTDILVAKDVSKTYFDTVEKDNVVALQGLSLSVRRPLMALLLVMWLRVFR